VRTSARVGDGQADKGLDQLGLAVALDPGQAVDLRAAHVQVEPGQHVLAPRDHPDVLDLEHRLPGGRLALDPPQQHRPADHHLGHLVGVGVGGGHGVDHLAVAEHGDPVGDLEHLVQRVGDEDDRLAVGLELAHVGEQLLDLLGDEHGRRLVEDQDVRPPVQQLEDLDPLLLADADVLDPGVGVQRGAEPTGQLLHPALGLAQVEAAPALVGLGPEDDVLGHREVVDQHEVLVDHADAQLDGLARRVDMLCFAPDQDLALVGLLKAVEHLHQGRLAGPVLADQGVDLALGHLQVDLVVGDDPGVAPGDAPALDGRRRAAGLGGPAAADLGRLGRHGYVAGLSGTLISPSAIFCFSSSRVVGMSPRSSLLYWFWA
jgi:hypothetical protein